MAPVVGKIAVMLGGAGLSLVLLASAAQATTAAPVRSVKASCTMSDGQKAELELKYRTSGGYHRVSDLLFWWDVATPVRLKAARLSMMVERRGKDREVFGKTFREKRASTTVSYDIIPGVKVPAGRRLYFAVDSTFVKKGATMRCAGRTAAV